jgi:negative regulator of flagellin synthesis FlgM
VKINSSIGSVGTSQGAAKPKRTTAVAGEAATTQSDQVELSLSGRVQEASAAIAEAPIVDAARVAEIKHAISEGQFKVNPERIADGLVDSVRQLLARQQQG